MYEKGRWVTRVKVLKNLRDNYIIWHANRFKVPEFTPRGICRKRVCFSGRVQNVGFRLELYSLAQRLDLAGWVRNLEDGSVEAEMQGDESEIDFLIGCMRSLKRATVKRVEVTEVAINQEDEEFIISK